jgi:hypothetical protein
MFDFNRRAITEQKKILWQNLAAANDIIRILQDQRALEGALFTHGETYNSLEDKLNYIIATSSKVLEGWDFKQTLGKTSLNYIWQDNKVLRNIFETHVRVRGLGPQSFDEFINPPYGWDVALRDWN